MFIILRIQENVCFSGLAIVESRVGEKMAERLVSELGLMFDDTKKVENVGRRKSFNSLEDLFKGDFKDKDDDVVEEIRLPNGQLQSRYF